MKKYRVEFSNTNAEVEAVNEDCAIEKAKELYYDGELFCEVTKIVELDTEERR